MHEQWLTLTLLSTYFITDANKLLLADFGYATVVSALVDDLFP